MVNNLDSLISEIQQTFGETLYIDIIKTGKEAQVHLLKVNGELRALKVYKTGTKFSSKNEYLQISEIGEKRIERAVKAKSKKGRSFMQSSWVNREYNILEELNQWNTYVPKVYLLLENAILMEYIGDGEKPAPRIADIQLEPEVRKEIYGIIMDHINLFKNLGFVHGDLSVYNILWHNNKPYIIDFPQIIYINSNSNWYSKYKNDLENVKKILSDS